MRKVVITSYTHEEDWLDADKAKEYSPDEYDFIWNDDHTKFRVLKLRWNSQVSYIRYQSMD